MSSEGHGPSVNDDFPEPGITANGRPRGMHTFDSGYSMPLLPSVHLHLEVRGLTVHTMLSPASARRAAAALISAAEAAEARPAQEAHRPREPGA